MSVTIPIGPPFKGLSLDLDPGATPGATVAMDCRIWPDGLRRMDPPRYLCNVASKARGLHFHTNASGERILLAATATRLYAASEASGFDAPAAASAVGTTTPFALTASDAPVLFQQDGWLSYFVDTGDASAPVFAWDERDGQIRSVSLPVAPSGVSVETQALASKVISALTGTDGAPIATPYTIVGAWNSAKWDSEPWGVPAARLNTGTTTVVGDGFYYTETAPLNLSGARITLDVWSGGNEKTTGQFLGFAIGASSWKEYIIPFSVDAANTTNHVVLDLSSYVPSSVLDSVTYWGLCATSVTSQFVVSFRNLHRQAGTVGPRKYLFTDVLTVGTGDAAMELASPEGPATPVEADAGALGSQVELSGTLPDSVTRKVWRWDTDTASAYHYVGDWTGPKFTDTEFDVSLNPTLQRGRVQAPVGARSIGMHNGILRVGVGNDIKGARMGDPTTWLDMTPEEWVQLEAAKLNTATAADGLRLPVSDIGRIVAMAQLGIATGADYRQDLVLFGDAGMLAVLTGTAPPYAIAHKAPGGIAGPLAWCSIPDGLAFVDPQGDVNILDRRLSVKKISGPIERVLREQAGRSAWLLGYDASTVTLALWAQTRRFAYDFQQDAWTELGAAWGGATVHASTGASEGAFLCFASDAGGIYRAMDRTFEPVPWKARMPLAEGDAVAPGNDYWYELTECAHGEAFDAPPAWPSTPWDVAVDAYGNVWSYRGPYPSGWAYLTADYTRRNARLGMDNAPVRLRCETENYVTAKVFADDTEAAWGVAGWQYPLYCLPYSGARLSVEFEGDSNAALLSATLEAAVRRP